MPLSLPPATPLGVAVAADMTAGQWQAVPAPGLRVEDDQVEGELLVGELDEVAPLVEVGLQWHGQDGDVVHVRP